MVRCCRVFPVALLAILSAWGCSSDNPAAPAIGGAASGGAGGTSPGPGAGTGGSVSPSGGAGAGAGASGVGGSPLTTAGAGGNATGGNAAGANAGAGTSAGGGAGGAASAHPLIDVLAKFTAPDVPVRGPMEANPQPRVSNGAVPTRPGNGLAQHPMLYIGEGYNRILLVNEGKVIWTYDTEPGNELDDVWMLSNGNVLYSHMNFVEELSPKKDVVWHYDPPAGAEIHSCQPIGLDKVLIALNQVPSPKLQLIDIKTSKIELEHAFTDEMSSGAHGQLRRMRMTKDGTYLMAWLGRKVVEYDKDFKPLHTLATGAWSVAPLHNGNVLIMDEGQSTCKEMNSQGAVVWSLKKTDINVPDAKLGGNTQTCERLASGNTVMLFHSTEGNVQAVEVTPDKQVVWALEDWKNLGPATSVQFLDEPGIPEVPGATEH
jgi:hypothetical protein